MKKTKLFGLALIATMASFTACTNDSEEVLAQESEIKLTSEIMPSRAASNLQSTQIVAGQEVGVTITGIKEGQEHNNIAWSVGDNGALTNTGDAVYYGDGTATITAYHPYNSTWTGTSHEFSVSTDQSTNAEYLASDLLWATATSTKTENPVPLTFSHKLAKINVTLVPENEDDDLNGATISIYNTKTSTTFNPTTGAISTATGEAQEIIAGVTADDVYTASAIVIPQEVSGKFIKITHEGKTYYYTLSSAKTLVAGHSYSYTLTVKGKQLISTSSSINPWNPDSEEAEEGDAEEEVFKMPAVDLGLSVKWASYNLGAESDTEMGDLYAWGETSPRNTWTKENYAYYNVTNDTYENLGDDISGTEYDAATTTLGKGWRMPTKAEWEELKRNCIETSYEKGRGFYYVFRSKINDNIIRIPHDFGPYHYWTSTDFTYSDASNTGDDEFIAPYYFYLNYDYTEMKYSSHPYQGNYIRAVYDGE